MVVVFGAALVAASLYGVGAVLQASGTRSASHQAASRFPFLAILRQRTYLAGLGCDFIAWILTVYSLQRFPLFAVQAIVASSLAVTVVIAHFAMHAPLRRADAVAIGLTIAGLILIGMAADVGQAKSPSRRIGLAVLVGAAVLAVISQGTRRISAFVSATVAGMSFAGGMLSARATHLDQGVAKLVGEPLTWAVLGYGLVGLISYTRALELGHVGSVTACVWTTEIIVSTVFGRLVLHDDVRSGWRWVALLGLALALASTVALARSPALAAAEEPARS